MTDGISVLIVESEPNLREELTSALTEAGFAVGSALDYHEALVALELLKPDIALWMKRCQVEIVSSLALDYAPGLTSILSC